MDEAREAGKLPRMHSRRRRLRSHKLTALLVVLIVIVGIGGASDLGYLALKSRADQLQASLAADLEAGQRDLEAGKALLTKANSKHDTSLITDAINKFVTAKSNFLSAGKRADDSRLLHYLEYAPAIGDFARSRHKAVDNIALMGAALADAGQDVANLDAEIIKPPSSSEAGRTLLTVLDVVNHGLGKVRADLQAAQTAAALVDAHVLPAAQQATFIKGRDSIDSALTGFAEFERLVPVLTDLLGGNGTRTYLVEQVNPIELRAGGGFIGSYSLLQASHGAVSVIRSGDSYDLANPRPAPGQPGFIPQPGPYREVIPEISWSFVDSNLFPDFPSNAKAAENFVQPRIGRIDGVVSLDIYAVAAMLKLTGPLKVPGYSLTLDTNNFVPVITQLDYSGNPIHKAILAALAGPLMAKISSLPADQWPTLVTALNTVAAERHLQAYFNNASVQAEIDRIGLSGTVNPPSASDYMMEVESNYGSKANLFLTRDYKVALSRSGNFLHHRVTVTLINKSPFGSYDRTYYHADIRLLVGTNASSLSNNLSAVKYANPDPPSGTRVLDGWAMVECCGSQGQAVFDYDTPWAPTRAGYEIYWQKQPGTGNDAVTVNWIDAQGHTFTTRGDIGQDRVINLSTAGVALTPGQAAQASLPSLSLG
jgi:hypothetical protein